MSENETKEPTAEAVVETQPEATEEVKAEATETVEATSETTTEAAAEATGTVEATSETATEAAAEAASEKTTDAAAEAKTEETVEAAADTPAEPEVPEEPEEISYHAVEKDDEITAIWEMQGRKHIRTISARSGEGQKILSLFTSEIHETDSPAMGNKAETTEEAAA